MSGTHGVFQHRTGYFYTILEEDFCEMYKAEGVNEVCRAYITSILENLTNKQFDGTGDNKEIWVYISLPEMARRMRHAYSERTIHKEVQGMIKDEYLKKRRAVSKATMEYCLNLKKIRDGLASLPDKQSCNSATSNLANLQDQSRNSARLTLQNCNNDLAELQPRISNRLNKEETKEEGTVSENANAPDVAQPIDPLPSLPIDTTPTEPKTTSSKKGVRVTRQRNTEPLKKAAPKLEDMSLEAQHVWEVWLKMPWNKGVPPKLTLTAIAHCEYLSKVEVTEIIMFKVRNFAKKNDRNGFYEGKSWELGHVVSEYPRWQSAEYQAQPEPKEEKKMTVANLGLRPISSLPRL